MATMTAVIITTNRTVTVPQIISDAKGAIAFPKVGFVMAIKIACPDRMKPVAVSELFH